MIPKIITTNEGDSVDEIISQFADALHIHSSHRIVVQPEKDELTVDQIHLMQKDIQFAFSQKVLVALIGVDASSNEVQNSLLKCIEEDSERIQFLFIIQNTARLLPTVLSRCSIKESGRNIPKESVVVISDDHFSLQNNSDTNKVDALIKIDRYLEFAELKNQQVLNYILQIRSLIINNNLNPISALDAILIFLTKTSTMNIVHEK